MLTKSLYLIGRQCLRRLWLRANGPEEPPMESEDVWEAREAEGAAVEALAEGLFPNAERVVAAVDDKSVLEGDVAFDQREARTRAYIEDQVTIFQAHLRDGELAAIADVLEARDDGWYLWEVKSSTKHVAIFDWDLAFQALIASRMGIELCGIGVIHLDQDYELVDGMEPDEILKREDRTAAISAISATVAGEVDRQLACLQESEMPEVTPTTHCKGSRSIKAGNRPSSCGHLKKEGVCGVDLPEHWAWDIPRLGGAKANYVADMPVADLRLIDPDDQELNWTDSQAKVIRAARSGELELDEPALREFLEQLQWPVAYVDFEFDPGMAIPRFRGCHPYDRLPFQWSMHLQDEPAAQLRQYDPPCLQLGTDDPRRPFAEKLLEALPDSGSIVVHHGAAESTVLVQLAERLGGDLGERLASLPERFFDTEKFLKAGYYHPEQHGSYSIKKVAPPLTGRGYGDLDVQDGMAAVMEWKRACDPDRTEDQRGESTRRLREYCGRDTELMHEIIEAIRELVE